MFISGFFIIEEEDMHKSNHTRNLLSIFILIIITGCAAPKGATLREQRNYVLEMRGKTLSELYEKKPYLERYIQKAIGYGVFSTINTNLIILSTANGYGVVKDNKTGEDIYMKMGQLGVGPGLGLKDFKAVILFKDREVFNNFIEKGWAFAGNADATAKSKEKGGAIGGEAYLSKGVRIYTITETGVAIQASIAGVKYWKDNALN